MSFILDALKKSENDRQRQTSPALFEVKVASPRRRLPLWAVGLAVLFVVNAAALAWLLLRAPAAPALAAANQNPGANAATIYSTPTNTAPPGMVTVPATVTIPTTVNIPVGSAPTITMDAPNTQAGAVAPSGTPPLAEEPMLSAHQQAVPPDYNANDYVEALTPAQAQGQAQAMAAERRAGDVPSRDEVLARGTQLPDLRLDMHVYDPNPANRFVFINMRKLREGDALPDGARVESITQHGVRMSWHGTRFNIDGN